MNISISYSKKFKMYYQNLQCFSLFLMNNFENRQKKMKISDWSKVQNCLSNILTCKYPSKMFQYSKRNFRCQFSNETDPNQLGFLFQEKLCKKCGAIFLKSLKDCAMVFVHFFQK